MSFRRRTVLLASAAVALAVLLASALVYVLTDNELSGQLDASLRARLVPGQKQSIEIRQERLTPKHRRLIEHAMASFGRSERDPGESGQESVAIHVQPSGGSLPPIIRRGVLIDLVAARGGRLPPRYLVERDELAAVADQQGVHVRPGDVLLIHTGWGAAWHDPDYITGGGMARSCGEWAVEQRAYAVGADNMSWDLPGYTDPELGHTLPNHTLLLARAGILIFENLLLEDLAATGAREFAFVSLPLKLVGATGSPTRPVAIITQHSQAQEGH